VVKPAARREIVGYLQQVYAMSQRQACRLASLSRKAASYVPLQRPDEPLRQRLKELGEQYPRYGYLLLHGMLFAEKLVVNRKRTYRIYTDLGMQVRTRKRKKLVRPRVRSDNQPETPATIKMRQTCRRCRHDGRA
jgi:putative transposase